MSGLRITAACVALALTPILIGWTIVDGRLELASGSRLWIEGTSSVRSFKCNATTLEADIATAEEGAVTAVLAGRKAVKMVSVRVPAGQLDCRNGTMNRHMRNALKAEANPTIAFDMKSYALVPADASVWTKLDGTLRLGGVVKDVALDAALSRDPEGRLRVKGSYDLQMTEYGLKPPTLMMGTMKVGDMVTVRFDLLLQE